MMKPLRFRAPAAVRTAEPGRRSGYSGRMGLALLAAVALLPVATTRAAEFTAAQRAEIVQILRDALKQDPSILRDAVAALQADEGDAPGGQRSRAAIAAHHDTLIDRRPTRSPATRRATSRSSSSSTRAARIAGKFEPTMAQLLAQDHGVRLVYKDLPILGPASVLGAKALLAAQRQGGYEQLRDAVMQAPPDTTMELIRAPGGEAGPGLAAPGSTTWTTRRSLRSSTPT